MTRETFISNWAGLWKNSYNYEYITKRFTNELTELIDQETKAQQNAAQGLLDALIEVVGSDRVTKQIEISEKAINEYKEATK